MRPHRQDPARPWILIAVIAVQALCAAVFLGDMIADLGGLEAGEAEHGEGPHAYIEGLAALALAAAIVIETRILLWLLRRKAHLEETLNAAQAAVQDVIDAEFANWGLTPAELDVATFLVKGLSTAEIAAMRGSAEGTVKAQLNAIYRKSGTGNRAELMSLLIDTMMGQRQPDTGEGAASRPA
ncbi:helix-turn-helix transcriptional regulator [Leisingera aquaemixtae]|uniref:helix-turn-helix transcriptional regulator n=1 Tax=Leisingera aquaemixtae TaxID=1396826 RepID=UPI001C95A026|nr:helix-turn-helix transcriptional regulator [Leisingera aquaemixtae]MBY6065930.1 helix-turn-helix transcriptional regulator [Leisingera aquaemixtae]